MLALARARIPTLVIHSVETAGVVPRQPHEYSSTFDFGPVYAAAGLEPVECVSPLPDVPLRQRPFRCTSDITRSVKGFVIDTGEGEAAHEAVVPVGLAFFLRHYVSTGQSNDGP
jgi:hypothetical protein